ncbi:ion transporter [Phormidium sp. CCY1219]|uniref:ion transporter n=1 Tax=Phormidium sp. CCY1219 TaxID=2886104 RepID=UPI002D1E9408|nr:ion transporter [Phormidium sp. CCY1219]MEB3826174.1 ion transporter [Phormidium sp. CCY1219]
MRGFPLSIALLPMNEQLKRRIYIILDVAGASDRLSQLFDVFIISLILLNVVAVALETVDWITAEFSDAFQSFETFSVTVFTLEYILRVWSCNASPRFRHPVWGRLKYTLTPLALIDLIAIIPFYLPFLFVDLRIIRALRLFRLLRLFKLGRYSKSLRTLIKVIFSKREELILTFSAVILLLLAASSIIYFAEHEAQPEAFPHIPAAMWWGVVTLTTVGYGDVYPVTAIGKVFGAGVAMLGIGIFALPAGILASGFSEEIAARKERRKKIIRPPQICPHCGKNIHEPPK